MTKVKQKIKDPDNPLTEEVLTLRHHRWDEEDRLRGVDLMPDNDPKRPEIASYTYDASGERTVRYVPGRLDAFYSAHQAGGTDRLESFVYPNGLITGKTLPEMDTNKQIMTYTKHYYIGSERISSSIGMGNSVGNYICHSGFPTAAAMNLMNQKVAAAAASLQDDYDYFEKQLTLSQPFTGRPGCGISFMGPEIRYWYHPDLPIIIGMGSSSYISNDNGEISQHLEYLPFGETLVEEHKNSNNSPYKFNGKELDDETGNYYYGARYYNPKWSFWLSVDPLAEQAPGKTPYHFVSNNPINSIDPLGLTDYKINRETGEINQVGEIKDKSDRILQTRKNGNVKKKGEGFLGFLVRKSERGKPKVGIDGIAKGILEDGLNLKEKDATFEINGDGQPSLKDFNKFISEFSDYIGKEIVGIRLGEENSTDVTTIKTYRYKNNTRTTSGTPLSWFSKFGDKLKGHFHTHPYKIHTPSEDFDVPLRNRYPNLPFFIISNGYEKEF